MNGLDMAGDGEKDLSIGTENTGQKDLGSKSGDDAVQFVGDGAKDVWNKSEPSLKGQYALNEPSKEGGGVDFTGNGSADA